MRFGIIPAAIICGLALSAIAATPERSLTFDERVAAQRAVEQVNWSHRNWPGDNTSPKPALATVLPDDAIRAKVEDYLKESAALESLWHRPITKAQLQAEIDRMTSHTKDGAGLRELFDALGNDPYVIAETVARPALANRLIRDWYATDSRFHADAKKKAEAARAACRDMTCMAARGGQYTEATWSLRGKDSKDSPLALRPEDWSHFRSDLARRLGGSGRPGRIEETPDAFVVSGFKEPSNDRIVVASVSWPKQPFETWWEAQRKTTPLPVSMPPPSYSIPMFDAAPCVPDTWTEASGAPDGHQGHTAVWTGSEMIIWGGWDAGQWNWTNTGARYSPATDTWTPTSMTGVPAARFEHAAVWTGTKMMIWGGNREGGGLYDPTSNTWTDLPTTGAPGGCKQRALRWTGSEVIVWGGDCGPSDGARFSPATNTWTSMSTVNVPDAGYGSSVIWSGSEMIVWGGSGDSGTVNTGRRYNPGTNSWLPISVVGAPSPRYGAAAVWSGSEMLVWGGGFDSGVPGTGGRYRPSDDTWIAMNSTGAPSDRYAPTAVWTGSDMVVWGGGSESDTPGTGGRYRPATNDWLATTTQGAPAARQFHSAVWTGSEMIVWGGYGNTGGRYDPINDSWIPTSTTPGPRFSHTAIWTGAELIVWGGSSRYVPVPDPRGARYSPATDDWTATTSIGAPSPRASHSAVWTGTEMIVWGGNPTNGPPVSTGGRYAPATDTWIATSLVNAPSPRSAHTAVWTGDEMIVWGGDDSVTGSRYRPSSDAWVSTSTVNAPTARNHHTAVWTGTEMLVWGGDPSTNAPGTGGRYAPATNSWAPTNVTGAPKTRYGHSAVWTGEEMIVWGGWNGTGFFACPDCWLMDGGRFDPLQDKWATTTEVGVPERRTDHRAVWTGQHMIVFGGNDDLWNLSSGGRYSAKSDSWSATTLSGAPSLREYHTSTWTGRQMIVFGGFDYPNDTGTGALYCACPNGTLTYRDADGDGYGSTVPMPSCDGSLRPGYVANALDCDDTNATVHPAATEQCNGEDDTCDGLIDEGLSRTIYLDADGDGYGDPEATEETCESPPGWVLQAGDCNDGNPTTHPGAVESCNAVDDNCNGSVDEDSLGVDTDGDQVRNACDNCRSTFNAEQTDTDEDGVGNACDNCITVANAAQQDTDADQLGDMCDNCAATYNPNQHDFDSDRRGDACDNCLFVENPTQSDFDHDAQGDACDLNDGLIYVYATDRNFVEWQDENGPTRWNVYEGDLAVLKAGGSYTQALGSNPLADRHCNVFNQYVDDLEPVPPHACKFSLVTGKTGPTEGSLGTNSHGVTRPNVNPCP